MEAEKRKLSPFTCISFISIFGFMLGTVMVSLWQDNLFFQNCILDSDFIHEIGNLYVDKRALFFLCLEKRLRAFFVMILMSSSVWNWGTVLFFFFFHGFAVGSMVELMIIRYGWQGIMLYFSAIFPQSIFYILGYLILGCWCLRRGKRTFADMNWGLVLCALFINLIGIYMESEFSVKIFSTILDL